MPLSSRRLRAVVLNVLFAQSVWAGSWLSCVRSDAMPSVAMRDVEAAHQARAIQGAGMAAPASRSIDGDDVPANGDAPCGAPMTPMACPYAQLCPALALTADGVVRVGFVARGTEMTDLRAALAPPSLTIAPEPPPPKA